MASVGGREGTRRGQLPGVAPGAFPGFQRWEGAGGGWRWGHHRCVPKGWGQRGDSGVTTPGWGTTTNPRESQLFHEVFNSHGSSPATPRATSARGDIVPKGHLPQTRGGTRGDTERGQIQRGGTRATPEGGKGGTVGIFPVLCTKFPAGGGDRDIQGHLGTSSHPAVAWGQNNSAN